MARIRSVKPELRSSAVVASWPLEVRYFFVLLWGYLDDSGRGLDAPRQIAGDCFPYDEKITAAKINGWLALMGKGHAGEQGPVCRYTHGGKKYLHCVNWREHQRPNRPTASRMPPCPVHDHPQDGPQAGLSESLTESLTEDGPRDTPTKSVSGRLNQSALAMQKHDVRITKPHISQSVRMATGLTEPGLNGSSLVTASGLTESLHANAVTGAGEQGRRGGEERSGSLRSPSARAAEPPADSEAGGAEKIITAWMDECAKRPPARTVNDVGRQVAALLAEGIDPADVAEGVRLWQRRGLHPSTLPSVVNQVMNSPAPDGPSNVVALRQDRRPSTTDQRVADALALGAELAREAHDDAG